MLQYNWSASTETRKYSLKRKLDLLTLSYAGREAFWPLSGFSSTTLGVISRGCWNLLSFSQIVWEIFKWQKNFQLFYCFHVAPLLFMNARQILRHFLTIFMVFLINYQKSQSFHSKLWFFAIFNTSLPFWFKILSGRQLSIFGWFL